MGRFGNLRFYSRRIVLCISCGPLLRFFCISRRSASGPSFVTRNWEESFTSARCLFKGTRLSQTSSPFISLSISQQPSAFSDLPLIPL